MDAPSKVLLAHSISGILIILTGPGDPIEIPMDVNVSSDNGLIGTVDSVDGNNSC